MLLVGFGIPVALQSGLHIGKDDLIQIISGILLISMDFAWRFGRRGEDDWQDVVVDRTRGGQLFFVPIWIWGLLWVVLGAYRLAVP